MKTITHEFFDAAGNRVASATGEFAAQLFLPGTIAVQDPQGRLPEAEGLNGLTFLNWPRLVETHDPTLRAVTRESGDWSHITL